MSERKWTPEPWKLNKTNHGLHIISIAGEVPGKSGRTHNGYLFEVLPSRPFGEWHENGMRAVECVNACTGAPAAIQPGSVVALADSLRTLLAVAEVNDPRQPGIDKARAALALYNGATT